MGACASTSSPAVSSAATRDAAMLAQLRSGALQFQALPGGVLSPVVPLAAIEGVAFAFPDEATAFRAFDGDLGAYVRDEIASKGIYAFPKVWGNGFRQITSGTKAIRVPDDLAGFKIRTPPSALSIDLFKTLGAAPTPLVVTEVYTGLQTHIVDGEENPYVIIQNFRLYEVQKYLSVTNHSWSGFWLIGNQDAVNALPADVRDVVERNMAKYALLQRADNAKVNLALTESLRKGGLAFNDTDPRLFQARCGPHYARWKATFGPKAWALLEQYGRKLDAA
jgi:tripartite ATP-independent transporter DctP family solute receptor